MNKFKLALKIVGAVGIAFWTACCFLGLFFASDGKMMVAIPVTLIIGVLLFLSYFLLLKFQDKDTRQGNAKSAKTLEFVFLGVYLATVVCSAYYVNHLVKTYNSRDSIRETARNAIGELTVTFSTEDNVMYSYREWVGEELSRYQRHVSDNPENYAGDTDLLWVDFEDKLLNEGYENLELKVNECINQIEASVVDAWYLPTLLQRLKELQQKPEWEQEAVEFSKGHEYTENDPFEPVSTKDCAGITDGLTQTDFSVSGVAIFIMVVLQVVILLAYLLFVKWHGIRQGPKLGEDVGVWVWDDKKKQNQ